MVHALDKHTQSNKVYEDSLIEITADSILLKNYYFPFMNARRVRFDEMTYIEVKEPTVMSGKWRVQGTGNFRTWFPLDAARMKRDRTFIINLVNKWMNIGFTVEDSEAVTQILRSTISVELK